jgi:hypothetical protein
MDRMIDKQEKLMRRIERNFADYKAAVLKLDKQSIFDKFSENWKKLGGEEITKEINSIYNNSN